MITDPDLSSTPLVEAGADTLIVHVEGNMNLHRTVQRIRAWQAGGRGDQSRHACRMLVEILSDVDLVLVMTVNPGFGGQKFIPSMLDKIRHMRQRIDDQPRNIELEVDGGIDPMTAPLGVSAGADVLVAGIGDLRRPRGRRGGHAPPSSRDRQCRHVSSPHPAYGKFLHILATWLGGRPLFHADPVGLLLLHQWPCCPFVLSRAHCLHTHPADVSCDVFEEIVASVVSGWPGMKRIAGIGSWHGVRTGG